MKDLKPISELEEKILNEKAREIAKYFDNEMLRELLISCGWVEVKFHFNSSEQEYDILNWCKVNIKNNQWKKLNDSFVFRKQKYAAWFILNWK